MKTNRGFELIKFTDDYGVQCSIQESSQLDPHIWLGIDRPELSILTKDRGWQNWQVPDEVLIGSRMLLNQKQALILANQLLYFSKNGCLQEEKI